MSVNLEARELHFRSQSRRTSALTELEPTEARELRHRRDRPSIWRLMSRVSLPGPSHLCAPGVRAYRRLVSCFSADGFTANTEAREVARARSLGAINNPSIRSATAA